MAQGALTAAAFGKELVPVSDCRALEAQASELHPLLGRKAIENERLREAVSQAASSGELLLCSTSPRWMDGERNRRGRRHHLPIPAGNALSPSARSYGGPPLANAASVADICTFVAELPTYGYRSVHALLRREAKKPSAKPPIRNAFTAS